MAVEFPVGFTGDGHLITGYRFSESDLGDIYMANEMRAASPDGQAVYRRLTDSGTPGSFEVNGYWDAG